MLGINALIKDDLVETISNVSIMLEAGSKNLKRLARETNNPELMAMSLSAENSLNALRAVEVELEIKGEVWEPGVDQVTPATP